MKKHRFSLKPMLALVCVFLFTLCIFGSFLPHAHCEYDSECEICALIEFHRNALTGFVLLAVIFVNIGGQCINCAHKQIMLICNATLVGLKVKLSN